jgi:hypothetical protein
LLLLVVAVVVSLRLLVVAQEDLELMFQDIH